MASRGLLFHVARHRDTGKVLVNALVHLYQRGTVTPVTGLHDDDEAGNPVTSPMATDGRGRVIVYADVPQSVTLRITDNGGQAHYPDDPNTFVPFAEFSQDAEIFPSPRDIPTMVNVKAYGATGDGTTDDAAAIQAAIAAAAAASGTSKADVFFPPGTYLVASSLLLPSGTDTTRQRKMRLVGYGATLKTTAAIPILSRALPADSTEANRWIQWRFIIEGLRFEGNSTAGQKGIFLPATYGTVIRDCAFVTLDYGVHIIFGLKSILDNCMDRECVSYGYYLTSAIDGGAQWTGALVTNNCNHSEFRSCRSYGKAGMTAQFFIKESNGVVLDQCIAEGENPVNAVHFDKGAHTSIRYFEVRNLHSENTPTNAVVKAVAAGRVVISGGRHNTNVVMVDASGSDAAAMFVVRDLAFIPSGATFKHGAGELYQWIFDGVGAHQQADLSSSTFWSGGTVPATYQVFRSSLASEVGGSGKTAMIQSPHINLRGAIHLPYKSVSATSTLGDGDYMVAVDASGGARTINLPTAVNRVGRVYVIKKIDSSVNAVTIDPNGAQTVDGAATLALALQWDRATVMSDGANWLRLD